MTRDEWQTLLGILKDLGLIVVGVDTTTDTVTVRVPKIRS